jgi:isocitrate dehydrogenase kinase/phosphatase
MPRKLSETSFSKPLGIDLKNVVPLAVDRADIRNRIDDAFAAAMPRAAEQMVNLMEGAEKEDVRFRAANLILSHFAPEQAESKGNSPTIQILNYMPIPEMAAMVSSTGMDIGRSTAPVCHDYEPPFDFPGTIRRVVFDIRPRTPKTERREALGTERRVKGQQ